MLRSVLHQLEMLLTGQAPRPAPSPSASAEPPSRPPALAGPAPVRYEFVRNSKARRYVLRVRRERVVRVTIPRGGSESFARGFLAEKADWIQTQLDRLANEPGHASRWDADTLVLFRGERVPLEPMPGGCRLGDEFIRLREPQTDWRPAVEAHLRQLADLELPPLVGAFAARHGLPLKRVSVRSQRSRWGSCSRLGTVSLNWRLVQTPILVRDYLIAHELAHLRQMNHSQRFWQVVEGYFPAWREAERWLRQHGRELLG